MEKKDERIITSMYWSLYKEIKCWQNIREHLHMVSLTMLFEHAFTNSFVNTICSVRVDHCKVTNFTHVKDMRSFKRRTSMICHDLRYTTIILSEILWKIKLWTKAPCPQTQHSDSNSQCTPCIRITSLFKLVIWSSCWNSVPG